MAQERILVVDDEEVLTDVLRFNLQAEGFEVRTALSAEEALRMDVDSFDLVLLDVMMGQIDGFEMAQRLKNNPQTAAVPIIFCTAKDSENDTVGGLSIGADDYITKPYSVREVVARVKAVLRRSSAAKQQKGDRLVFETLVVDLQSKRCTIDSTDVSLTKKEFDILTFLLSNRGVVFSREAILSRVWSDDVVVVDRTVDVTVTRLRKKLGDYGRLITTRHGYGYGFES